MSEVPTMGDLATWVRDAPAGLHDRTLYLAAWEAGRRGLLFEGSRCTELVEAGMAAGLSRDECRFAAYRGLSSGCMERWRMEEEGR